MTGNLQKMYWNTLRLLLVVGWLLISELAIKSKFWVICEGEDTGEI